MKSSTPLILFISSILGTGLATAQDSDKQTQPRPMHRPLPKEVIAKYDTNGDGKLDETELAKLRLDKAHEFIAKHDKDGDAKLSTEELAAAFETMGPFRGGRPDGPEGKNRKEGGPKPEILEKLKKHRAEMLKKFDANGDGKLDDGERAKMRSERAAAIVAKFDKDGDGKLNADELVAARLAMRMHAGRPGPQKANPKADDTADE